MFVWKNWITEKRSKYSVYTKVKHYKMLALFGIIPLWISVVVREER